MHFKSFQYFAPDNIYRAGQNCRMPMISVIYSEFLRGNSSGPRLELVRNTPPAPGVISDSLPHRSQLIGLEILMRWRGYWTNWPTGTVFNCRNPPESDPNYNHQWTGAPIEGLSSPSHKLPPSKSLENKNGKLDPNSRHMLNLLTKNLVRPLIYSVSFSEVTGGSKWLHAWRT